MKKIYSLIAVAACMAMVSCGNGGNNGNNEGEAVLPEENALEAVESAAAADSAVSAEVAACDSCCAAADSLKAVADSLIADALEGVDETVADAQAEVDEAAEAVVPVAAVEVKPTFNGGDANSFHKWVQSQLKYPQAALENNESGKVIVSFVVNKKGKVSDVKVVKSVSPALDEEAVRVIASSPDWTPGSTRIGRKVDVNYTMPVVFAIN